MKRLGCFFICVISINFSCPKTTRDVHFHGRITLDCNYQIPVKNCKVEIAREYDTGTHQYKSIGSTFTDNDGYCTMITNVKQQGSFMHYDYSFKTGEGSPASSFPQFSGNAQSSDNDKDIEVNLNAERSKAYIFHIKNVSPVNSSDVLNSVIISHLNADNNPLFDLTKYIHVTRKQICTVFGK